MSLQLPNSNLLTISDTIVGFVKKLEQWRGQFDGGNVDMFPTLDEFLIKNVLNWNVTKKKKGKNDSPSASIFLSRIVGTSTTRFVNF